MSEEGFACNQATNAEQSMRNEIGMRILQSLSRYPQRQKARENKALLTG